MDYEHLQSSRSLTRSALTDLDDRDDIGCRVLKLAHVDREMLQLVLLGLLEHQS